MNRAKVWGAVKQNWFRSLVIVWAAWATGVLIQMRDAATSSVDDASRTQVEIASAKAEIAALRAQIESDTRKRDLDRIFDRMSRR